MKATYKSQFEFKVKIEGINNTASQSTLPSSVMDWNLVIAKCIFIVGLNTIWFPKLECADNNTSTQPTRLASPSFESDFIELGNVLLNTFFKSNDTQGITGSLKKSGNKTSDSGEVIEAYQAPPPAEPPLMIAGLTPAMIGPFLSLGTFAIQSPLVFFLFSLIITNLTLSSIGIASLKESVSNAETVLENINNYVGATPQRMDTRNSSRHSNGRSDDDSVEEFVILKRSGNPYVKQQRIKDEGMSKASLIPAALFVLVTVKEVGIVPGFLSAAILSYIFKQHYNSKRQPTFYQSPFTSFQNHKQEIQFPINQMLQIIQASILQ